MDRHDRESPPRKLSVLSSCSVSLTWILEKGGFLFHLDYERFILLNFIIHFNIHYYFVSLYLMENNMYMYVHAKFVD